MRPDSNGRSLVLLHIHHLVYCRAARFSDRQTLNKIGVVESSVNPASLVLQGEGHGVWFVSLNSVLAGRLPTPLRHVEAELGLEFSGSEIDGISTVPSVHLCERVPVGFVKASIISTSK